jgi:hypothetical protein
MYARTQWQARPQKVTHFRGPLTLHNIRGQWFSTMVDGMFAVVWGRANNCWAYLHDFDPVSREIMMEDCRNLIEYRERPHGAPYWMR